MVSNSLLAWRITWWALRRDGVCEWYIEIIEDVHAGALTNFKSCSNTTGAFQSQ